MAGLGKVASVVTVLLFLCSSIVFVTAVAAQPEGKLEKIVIKKYEGGRLVAAKKPGDTATSGYYAFLAKGAKWKSTPITYVIDPDNPFGLTEQFIVGAVSSAAEEWDAHTGTELFGAYSVDYNASWDIAAPDGRNEALFGNYPDEGVVAVAVVWGIFSGAVRDRKIVEFDIMFDIDYNWGDATASGNAVMDLQNVATHEIGHGVGLADVYNSAAWQETMYGYVSYGEVLKRDLYYGDIRGIQALYGN
jgi:hypothetical protein